ncbi:MAG: hypothetical protein KDA25_10500, partial [Phycisphaerales bacterium]|nr:hypothetical protein [Phycisphaerales bacterium]
MNNGRGHMRAMLGAVALATIAGSAPAGGPTLTRAEAAAALLDKGSGVDITPVAQVWSPYIDYGFGPGFEGLLPAGSTVEPARLNVEPWVSAPILLGVDQYFFWIDDLPKEDFVHGTRFVFVDPSVAAPTVGNGGISVFVEGWWPVINGVPFLELDIHRTTLAPAGPGNPDGLIAGFAFEPPPPPPAPPGGGSPANVADANACGIVVNGSNDTHHKNNATRMKNDLQNVDGVPAGRINTVAGGNAA